MFGLFKPKPAPEGPVAFQFDDRIACSAEELYRIVDYADAMCWKREVGTVEPNGDSEFLMKLDMVPDIDFKLTVIEANPGQSYAYECVMEPRVGNLLRSLEGYEITPDDDGSCTVGLNVLAEFDPGLTMKEWKQEVQMMALAVNNSLAKLKIHVEEGIEKIRAIEEMQKVA